MEQWSITSAVSDSLLPSVSIILIAKTELHEHPPLQHCHTIPNYCIILKVNPVQQRQAFKNFSGSCTESFMLTCLPQTQLPRFSRTFYMKRVANSTLRAQFLNECLYCSLRENDSAQQHEQCGNRLAIKLGVFQHSAPTRDLQNVDSLLRAREAPRPWGTTYQIT